MYCFRVRSESGTEPNYEWAGNDGVTWPGVVNCLLQSSVCGKSGLGLGIEIFQGLKLVKLSFIPTNSVWNYMPGWSCAEPSSPVAMDYCSV